MKNINDIKIGDIVSVGINHDGFFIKKRVNAINGDAFEVDASSACAVKSVRFNKKTGQRVDLYTGMSYYRFASRWTSENENHNRRHKQEKS